MSRDTDASFVRFVDERSAELLRVAMYLTGQRDEAHDLVQTALERAYRKWAKLEPGGEFGYVRTIMVNAHNDGLRRVMRWGRKSGQRDPERTQVMSDGELQWVTPESRSPEALVVNRDLLRRGLDRLTDRERTAVVLRFCEDMSEAEVANQMGVAVGTVKSTVSRALAKLRVVAAPAMAAGPAAHERGER
ncbi:RNA polymerase sigma factor [Propionibacteriaceae bacterium G1746]